MYRSVYIPICVVCLIVFVNCLLNEVAICFAVVAVFVFNVIVDFLLERPCIVFQRMYVLHL